MTVLVPIGDVERQTGIPQATLRIWERRYGFPRPLRDQFGHRVYPAHQIERLLKIRRLLDQGHRAGKLLSGGPESSAQADEQRAPGGPQLVALQLLRQYRLEDLRRLLYLRLMEMGLRNFVIDVLAPLTIEVGDAWRQGWLPVRCEHAYSMQVDRLMQNVLSTIPPPADGPLVLLATTNGELHNLGNLMVEAVLATLATPCLPLGTGLPLAEIIEGARECGADIVGLSFSAFMPRKSVLQAVAGVRAGLPAQVELWVGGDGASFTMPPLEGVSVFHDLAALETAIRDWRQRHAGGAQPLRQSSEKSG